MTCLNHLVWKAMRQVFNLTYHLGRSTAATGGGRYTLNTYATGAAATK